MFDPGFSYLRPLALLPHLRCKQAEEKSKVIQNNVALLGKSSLLVHNKAKTKDAFERQNKTIVGRVDKQIFDLRNIHLNNKLDLQLGHQLQPITCQECKLHVGFLVKLPV